MNYAYISLFIIGVGLIIVPVIRLFIPNFAMSKAVILRLEKRNTLKPYRISHNIVSVIFGAGCIAGVFLPEEYKIPVCMPLLAVIFIAVICCNMKYIGTPWAYVPPEKVE